MPFKYPVKIYNKSLLLIAAAGMFLLVSCKKAIEKQQENIILDAMTDGRWYVEQYKQDTTDLTAAFLGYQFQFYKNGNVDGINSAVTKTGTWNSNIANYTITANFPAAAGDTLRRLNYTWTITDSYLDYVEAKTTTITGSNILHLRKK